MLTCTVSISILQKYLQITSGWTENFIIPIAIRVYTVEYLLYSLLNMIKRRIYLKCLSVKRMHLSSFHSLLTSNTLILFYNLATTETSQYDLRIPSLYFKIADIF